MAITTLSGYKRTCRRNVGGVSRIGFIPVEGIKAITIEEHLVTAIEFESGQHFKDYQSTIDKAHFKFSGNEVTIKLQCGTITKEASVAYNELLDVCACGVIGIAKLNNGAVPLIGVSEDFMLERPIMDIESDADSGAAPSDENRFDITLKTSQPTAPLFLSDELAKQLDTLFAPAA